MDPVYLRVELKSMFGCLLSMAALLRILLLFDLPEFNLVTEAYGIQYARMMSRKIF